MRRLRYLAMMYLGSSTAKDTYWVAGANVFTSFLAFLYTIILARVFGPELLGIFSAILAFILLLSDIADIGIGSSLSRFLPPLLISGKEQKAQGIQKTAFFLEVVVVTVFSISVFFLASQISLLIFKTPEYTPLVQLAALGIIGTVLTAFATSTLSAQKKFRHVAIVNSASTLAKLFFVIILALFQLLTITFVTFMFVVSVFVSFVVSLRFLPLSFLKARSETGTLKKLLSFSVFLALARLFSASAGRLDALMLIPLSSAYEAGIYAGAYKIVFLYVLFASSFSMVIAPRLAGFPTLHQAFGYLKKIIGVVGLILVSIVFMYFLAPYFVVFVLGSDYAESVTVFQALLFPMALFSATIAPVNFLIYVLKKPQVSAFNTLAQLIIIFTGNYLFIPVFGRFGPVVSLTVAYSFTLISACAFSIYFVMKQND